MRFQLGPTSETVLIGERMLGIGRFARPHATQQFFSLFLEIFEIRLFR